MHPLLPRSSPTVFPLARLGRCARLFFALGVGGLTGSAVLAQDPATPGPASDPIVGTWTGTVTGPQGPTEIGFVFAAAAKGRFDVTLSMPVMHTYGFTFPQALGRENGAYSFEPLATVLELHGNRLTGTFGLGQLPVELHRGGALPTEPPVPHFPNGPAPRWKYPLGALTWAPPVAQDGVAYVGASDGKFHAVRVQDGQPLWTWSGPNRIDGRAAIAADTVLFVDSHIDLVCLDRAHGSLRWRFPLHDAQRAGKPAPDNPTFNHRSAIPLAIGDVVYCGSSDGGLYAIDRVTGQKKWRHEAGAPIFSGIATPLPDQIAFGTMDGSVIVLDRQSGAEIERCKAGGAVVTTPVFAADRVVVGGRDYQLYGFDRRSHQAAWRFSYWFSWVESTPRLEGDIAYVGASDFRRVTAFHPADGSVLWSTDVRGMCWGTPAVTTDTVFIGTAAQNIPGTVIRHTGGIVALDRQTGAVKWQILAAPAPENSFGGVAGSLAIDGDTLLAAGFDGMLAAYPVN